MNVHYLHSWSEEVADDISVLLDIDVQEEPAPEGLREHGNRAQDWHPSRAGREAPGRSQMPQDEDGGKGGHQVEEHGST